MDHRRPQMSQRPPSNRLQPVEQPQPTPIPPRSYHDKTKKRFSKKQIILSLALLLVAVAALFAWQYLSSPIMTNRYQAVFLNNGQVYFGKLHGYYGAHPYMTDVYYFQANTQTGKVNGNSDQLLVKLGQEVHAPENKLLLNKDAILFVENLTDGGKVVDAIKQSGIKPADTTTSGGITR